MKITDLQVHLLTGHWGDDPWFPRKLFPTAFIRVVTDAKVDGLKDVLSGHPGQSPVLLHVGAKVLRLPPEFNVDCRNGVVGELKRLLGQTAVLS